MNEEMALYERYWGFTMMLKILKKWRTWFSVTDWTLEPLKDRLRLRMSGWLRVSKRTAYPRKYGKK
jgi:hypothetical protein